MRAIVSIIEQLQAAGLQKPSAVICLVATRPADRRDFGHLAFCQLSEKLIRPPVVRHCNLFQILRAGGGSLLQISENLLPPLRFCKFSALSS